MLDKVPVARWEQLKQIWVQNRGVELGVNVWVSVFVPAVWAKDRELQHLLISLYTSKDHQETANTRDISDNVLHVENSKNRKLIGSRLSTTLKIISAYLQQIRGMETLTSVWRFSSKVKRNVWRDAAILIAAIFILKPLQFFATSKWFVSLLKGFLHSMSGRPCASASKSDFQAHNASSLS